MATSSQWVGGARPRTFPAALAPVAVGTGAAYAAGSGDPVAALLALCVALALQVGVNYANDYSDGIRGTDDAARRTGPVRLVGQGLAPAAHVKRAAFAAFGASMVFGLALVVVSGVWIMLAVGAACVLAAWYYTGGRRPYGYLGLGEVFVFVFFGLVATLGTTYTQAHTLTLPAWAGAVGVGALSCAVLMVNNLRDIPGDTVAGKRTLAVRLGDRGARRAYLGMLAAAAVCVLAAATVHVGALVALLSFGVAVPAVRRIVRGDLGRDLVPVLATTGLLTLAYGLLLAIGLNL